MVLNLKNHISFQSRENIYGKKENLLILNCSNCPEFTDSFFKKESCISCFLVNLFNNKNKKLDFISIKSLDILMKFNQFEPFLNYFNKIQKIIKTCHKIEKCKINNCPYKGFKCKHFPNLVDLFNLSENECYNPFNMYDLVIKSFKVINQNKDIDFVCNKCSNDIKDLKGSLIALLNKLDIIQKYKEFQEKCRIHQKDLSFFDYYFSNLLLLPSKKPKILNQSNRHSGKVLEVYDIGALEIFYASIYDNVNEYEKNYKINYFFKTLSEEQYFQNIIKYTMKNLKVMEFNKIIPISDLIDIYKNKALEIISSKYNLSQKKKEKLSLLIAIKKIKLEKLFPLLIDDKIEEIFLDSINDTIYINNKKYGRCRTDITLNLEDIDRLKTFFRLYSGRRLDYSNPSIKIVIKNKFFYCRFAVDIEPVHLNDFSFDIRKLNKNILSIQDLLKNGTLDPLMAAFLYFSVLRRINITVTGETDTGKTTLINALDLLTPKRFRKIYVENATESLDEIKFGKHQLKYKADSLEDVVNPKYSKSNQIKRLLHRTPDLIYLGEILTKEEAEAMFHCLSAGLKGFQTIHSNSVDSLINRILYHFEIDYSCLSDLGLIVQMKKDLFKRRIITISEIDINEEERRYYKNIFQFNPKLNTWELNYSIYEINTIKKLKQYEKLYEEEFLGLISLYSEIFEFLRRESKIDNYNLIDLFHQISYFSYKSFKDVRKFWDIKKDDLKAGLM